MNHTPMDVALGLAVAERRTVPDRRRRPTPLFSRHVWFGGRRASGGRRPGEDDDVFVDTHGVGMLAMVVLVIALNFLDSWFTVLFLSHGGTELNPIMDWVIRLGVWPFLLVKSVGIGLCAVILTAARNFRFARAGLAIILGGYSLLLCWHLWLLQYLPHE